MLTQSPKKKKLLKIFLDIVSVLAIITFINSLFSLFGITLPILSYLGLPFLIGLIFFLLMFKFAKLTKKYGWMLLSSLVIIGPIISLISGLIFFSTSFDLKKLVEGSTQTVPGGLVFLVYFSAIITLIGFASLIIFYFKYYRKYLSGESSLHELGVKEATNEEKFTEQYLEKEKKQNKIGWIIVITLALVLLGVFLYLQFS